MRLADTEEESGEFRRRRITDQSALEPEDNLVALDEALWQLQNDDTDSVPAASVSFIIDSTKVRGRSHLHFL